MRDMHLIRWTTEKYAILEHDGVAFASLQRHNSTAKACASPEGSSCGKYNFSHDEKSRNRSNAI